MLNRRNHDETHPWVHEHLLMTKKSHFDRAPLPDKGEHVARRGRKATGQTWSLIAGLPKERNSKGKRLRRPV